MDLSNRYGIGESLSFSRDEKIKKKEDEIWIIANKFLN